MTVANPWALRYAPHISFRGPGLFAEAAGSEDPVAQVEFAAEHGFAGVQDVIASSRSAADQMRIGQALRERDMVAGCFGLPFSEMAVAWGAMGPEDWPELKRVAQQGVEIAERMNSRHIAIVSRAAPQIPKWVQMDRMADNLKVVADVAASAGVTLVVESLDERRVPGMLLTNVQDAFFVVRMAGHSAVRLIFDTAHIQAMDGSLITNFRAVQPYVGLVQVADVPGRLEPGAGEINFETFFAELIGAGYQGLVELEHLWSRAGQEVQREGLARLGELDARAARRAKAAA
jgi:hydroxypyruvate isomerase